MEVELITPVVEVNACRDADDNMILELALSGDAQMIVTGDKDLLVLHPFRGVNIISPAEFLELIREQE